MIMVRLAATLCLANTSINFSVQLWRQALQLLSRIRANLYLADYSGVSSPFLSGSVNLASAIGPFDQFVVLFRPTHTKVLYSLQKQTPIQTKSYTDRL